MATLQSLTINDTGNITLPNGTQANRPTINNTIVRWTTSGATVLSGSATTSSTTWTCPSGVTNIEVLVVAGGGAGGGYHGGGGGAGGIIYNSNYAVTPTTVYTVTVGTGGSAATASSNTGDAGANSVFDKLIAIGGGAGLTQSGQPTSRNNGGSGGGGADGSGFMYGGSGTLGQGYPGATLYGSGVEQFIGYGTGGGGGAGGPGTGRQIVGGGAGGPGLCFDISGTPTWYGGGGGGTSLNQDGGFNGAVNMPPQAGYGLGGVGGGGVGGYINQNTNGNTALRSSASGVAGTGGGGGGYLYSGNGGGAGGSGTVIIRYSLTSASTSPIAHTRFNTTTNTLESYKNNNNWELQPINTNLVTNGLILHYDAARFVSGSATILDMGLGRQNGTLVGGISYSSTFGGCFLLDGSTGYINVPSDILPSGTPFTISGWIRPDSAASPNWGNGSMPLYNTYQNNSTNGHYDHFYHDYRFIAQQQGASPVSSTFPSGLVPGQWQLSTVTWDGYIMRYYKNGEETGNFNGLGAAGSGTGGTYTNQPNAYVTMSSSNPRIGMLATRSVSGDYNWKGNIATSYVYTRALSADEVQRNYNANARRFQLSPIPDKPAASASELLASGVSENGVYWLQPEGAPAAFRAYIDFKTVNGPWVHVGTAAGNKRELYTYRFTWCRRTENFGEITTPYNSNASSFNAGAFIYCRGNNIMIQHNSEGYFSDGWTQCSGLQHESWRDVYWFLNSRTGWPAQPSVQRNLTVTQRWGSVYGYNVSVTGLIYGTQDTAGTPNYGSFCVYVFDVSGDTFGYLVTGTYGNTGTQNEADHGIGVNENGPSANTFGTDGSATTADIAFDAGTNDATDSGNNATYNGHAFSLWIKN